MEPGNTVYCRHCGSAITVRTLVCPHCGMGQDVNAGKRNNKAVMVVVVAMAACFFGIVVLGIVAAIAIPQYAEHRSRGGDALARGELMKARFACESYLETNGCYPESLEQAGFKPTGDATVKYERESDECYSITAVHQNGRRIFAVTSNDAANVYFKQKDEPDSEFKLLQ